jgi:hypothetical protein
MFLSGKIAAILLKNERDLITTKWFDYRFLSPLDATQYFIDQYHKSYRKAWAKNFDSIESERRHGLQPGRLPTGKGVLTSVWTARQFADSLGAPYGLFLDEAFQLWLDAGHRLPCPNQLYAKKWKASIGLKVHAKMKEFLESKICYSNAPQYSLKAPVETSLRDEHVIWCMEQLKVSGAAGRIGRFVYGLHLVPEALAVTVFGAERVEEGRLENLRHPGIEEAIPDDLQFLPSCALLPQAFDAGAEQCLKCHFSDRCGMAKPNLMALINDTYGHEDPKLAQKREKNRLRVAKHRSNHKDKKPGREPEITCNAPQY